jgi:tripartite-type tricarboxylate transporter receptor subunit TctC
MISRRLISAALAAALATVGGVSSAGAQGADPAATYPNQVVRLVVPFSAGSMTDLLARLVADKLSTKWKSQVIVENRPGIAGTASVAKGPADGSVLLLTSNGHTIISAINKSINFDPVKDFVGVTQVAVTPAIMAAPPESPFKSVADMMAAAKAKPGVLNYGSAGLGSSTNIAAEILLQAAQVKMTHVPFKGLPESQTSIIRGDVAMGFTFFNVGGDLIQAGKMRGLAVTGQKRLAQLPDVPTFAEAGLPTYRYDAWFGVLAPAATPPSIVAKASRDIGEILNDADTQARFTAQGVNLVSQSPDRFDTILREDTQRFGALFREPRS